MWGSVWLAYFGYIWAIDGLTGVMPSRFCSLCSWRDVYPAHTPCMSAGGYSRAYARHWVCTVHSAQMARACLM